MTGIALSEHRPIRECVRHSLFMYAFSHGPVVRSVHGGSAANVLKGLGNLALQQRSARFMGMVGLDDAGR